MPRRGENIRKRKDGRWEGRYYVTIPQHGGNVLRSVYARTYGELKEKMSALKEAADKAPACIQKETPRQEPGISFGMAAEEWLSIIKKTKKHATYIKYRAVYQGHLREKLGGLLFSELNADILTEIFQTPRDGEAQSVSLQKSIACVLNQVLSHAVLHHHAEIPRFACQKRKMTPRPVQALSRVEQAKLLQSLCKSMDIYKLGIVVCLSTGLRLGEICSLKWEDIDLEGKMLYVNTTIQRIAMDGHEAKTILLEGEPKSIFSKRKIPLSEELVKLLMPYWGGAGEYVINGRKPMEPRTYQNKFRKYLESSGVARKNFHILRHTFATNCIESGTDIKSLSEILGHSDVKITLNRYVHPTTETKRQHMDSLFAIYGQFVGQQ